MDYIRVFEVELDKVIYHAGETLSGHVYLEVEENMRLQNIKILLRGKAHTEWKITRAGERRTMKQDETYMEEKMLLWGKEDSDSSHGVPILTRGRHHYPFNFLLPDSALPCSFESKVGTIRYYVRVNVNIPYASCPQSLKYFTIIGPRLDCMDERFLVPVQVVAKRSSCSLCCGKGPLVLRAAMDRTSYVCGEQIKLKADIQNGSDTEVWVVCKLVQYVEFFINKGVLGLTKEVRHTVLEAQSDKVPAHDSSSLDELMGRLTVPVMPPTLEETCGLIQIYYTLKLYMDTPKGKGDAAEISVPITICTMPYRNPNASPPEVYFDNAASNVEGGMYTSTEFQLGQVYMGDETDPETDQTILYRPVYMCTKSDIPDWRSDSHHLQVPTRQGGRTPDNIRSSREEFPQQENISACKTAPLAAAPREGGVVMEAGAKGGVAVVKPKPADKFLQEITAKIANRQLSEDGESKEGMGKADSQQQELESHVDMMRRQKQSNDFVHKALVNELRRHLSDADDHNPNPNTNTNTHTNNTPTAPAPAPAVGPGMLKKTTGVKKQMSESSVTSQQTTEPGKRMKTETKTMISSSTTSRNESEVVTTTTTAASSTTIPQEIAPHHPHHRAPQPPMYQERERCESQQQQQQHLQDVDLEVETNETTALIQDDVGVGKGGGEAEIEEVAEEEGRDIPMDTTTTCDNTNTNTHITESSPLLSSQEAEPIQDDLHLSMQQQQQHVLEHTSSYSTTHSKHTSSSLSSSVNTSSYDTVAKDNNTVPSSQEIHHETVEENMTVDEVISSNQKQDPSDLNLTHTGPCDVVVGGSREREPPPMFAAAPPPEPKPRSPKVAPKPRQKDRHSFPVSLRTASSEGSDGEGSSVDIKRPKSEFVVGHMDSQDSQSHSGHTDSTV